MKFDFFHTRLYKHCLYKTLLLCFSIKLVNGDQNSLTDHQSHFQPWLKIGATVLDIKWHHPALDTCLHIPAVHTRAAGVGVGVEGSNLQLDGITGYVQTSADV